MKTGSLVRRAVSYELGMWRSLYRWALRRPVAPGGTGFGYAATVTPVLLAFIGVSVIEIPILHFLLPWPTLRLVVFAASAYGLLWMIGLLASLRVHPHVVSDAGIRIRNGVSVDIMLHWDAIEAVRARRHSPPRSRAVQFEETGSGRVLHIVVLSQTNIDITLREPVTVALPRGAETVSGVRCYADDPSAFVARTRAALTTRPQT